MLKPMEKKYLKIDEAAEYMNVSLNTARKYCKEWGAEVHIGKAVRYNVNIIEEHMGEENR